MTKLAKIKELTKQLKKCHNREKRLSYHYDRYDKTNVDIFLDIRRISNLLERELSDLGIQFHCEDYGGDYCLNLLGLETVLKALENK